MQNLQIGSTVVELHDDGLTISRFPCGSEVHARPQDDPNYRARAVSLGYGRDALMMSREHEVVHHRLAVWLGLPYSPTMRALADRQVIPDRPYWPHWQAEEAAVLGVQRFARLAGVDLIALAGGRP